MSKKTSKLLIITRFHFLFLLAFLIANQAFSQTPKAENGVLDLRNYSFQEDKGTIDLTGDWQFYWGKFITPTDSIHEGLTGLIHVPSAWNLIKVNGIEPSPKGYATYRVTILLPETEKSYAISMRALSSAYTLFVNGDVVLNSGIPGTSEDEAKPAYYPNLGTFSASGEIDLILHVSNFEHRFGGMHNAFVFGPENKVILAKGLKIFIIFFLAGCFVIMTLYHAVTYIIIKNDSSPLWFALFCLLMAIRLMVTDEYVGSLYLPLSWPIIMKIEYFTLYGGLITFMGFFESLFSLYMNKTINKIIYAILIILTLSVIVLPPYYFTRMLPIGQVFVVMFGIYWFSVLLKARRNGNIESVIFMIGFVVIFLTAFNDILSSNEIIQSQVMIFYGIFIFIAVQAFLMSRRYSLATKRNEVLLNRLNEVNRNLELKVQERTGELEHQKESLEEKNERILIQNEALKKLNIQMDNFVYSVSHDLKAPLASAIGLINLAKNENDVSTLKHYFDLMGKSLNKLNRFINEILDFSRNARLQINKDEINFDEIVNGTLEQYQFYEDWKDIEKNVNIDQKGKFISDNQRINIVFNNLLSNALKYSTLGQKGAQVDISVKSDEKQAKITIKDTGSGIEEEHLEHIFDMFYRADTKKSGSGLGLYIVKETLEKLEGEIDIKSKSGKGTTVTFTIPNMLVME